MESKSITQMSKLDIINFVNDYNDKLHAKVLDFNNEYDFPDEILFDLIVAVEYLSLSGMIPKAQAEFAELLKGSEIELKKRLGNLPRVDGI